MALRVEAISFQEGQLRSKETGSPRVALFRNNLTASSQHQNALFIAYGDKIHVFRPIFPFQRVPFNPDLILDLPRSRSGLKGYLSPNSGHDVNHLIVGDFGNIEILLASCDDGDVVSYSMRSIEMAIDGAPRSPKPWFLENVGASAWGLAIHSVARLLAVSANTQVVTVFAPALSTASALDESYNNGDDGQTDMLNAMLGDESWHIVSDHPSQERDRNIRIELKGHHTNIPNIAFYNSGADAETIYLASTDIDGSTFVWNVCEGTGLLALRPSSTRQDFVWKPGWGVACLDPRMSRITDDLIDTFGCRGRVEEKATVIDISEGAQNVPDNQNWHPAWHPASANFGSVPVSSTMEQVVATSDEPDIESEETEAESTESTDEIPETFGSEGAAGVDEGFEQTSDSEHEDSDSDFLLAEDLLKHRLGTGSKALMPELPSSIDIPFHLFRASKTDLELFLDINAFKDSSSSQGAIILCEQAIHQKIPPGLHQLRDLERLNMIAQIPEIGVVLVGNQAGRVGVLTMTRCKVQGQSGFKVEHIVPFKSQEDLGMRPKVLLMGMTVSPIQGYETDADSATVGSPKRFRLLMVYCNHAIMTYEIYRETADDVLVTRLA